MPRVPQAIVDERRQRLAELVRSLGYLPVEELCRRLDVSPATCRRDLAALAGQREVHRTFGGALPGGPSPGLSEFDATFASFRQRRRVAQQSKATIARRAMALIAPGRTIFLDAGTTTFRLAEELTKRRVAPLTVVTHSLVVAAHLAASHDITVHLLGGQVLARQGLTLGRATETAVERFKFDIALLGAEGVTNEGLWNSQDDVARLQRAVMRRSRASYVLIDETKIGRPSAARVLAWDEPLARRVRIVSDACERRRRKFNMDGLSPLFVSSKSPSRTRTRP